jgi:hypothetical protein
MKGPDPVLVLGHQHYPKHAVKGEKTTTSCNHTILHIYLMTLQDLLQLCNTKYREYWIRNDVEIGCGLSEAIIPTRAYKDIRDRNSVS